MPSRENVSAGQEGQAGRAPRRRRTAAPKADGGPEHLSIITTTAQYNKVFVHAAEVIGNRVKVSAVPYSEVKMRRMVEDPSSLIPPRSEPTPRVIKVSRVSIRAVNMEALNALDEAIQAVQPRFFREDRGAAGRRAAGLHPEMKYWDSDAIKKWMTGRIAAQRGPQGEAATQPAPPGEQTAAKK